MADENTNPDTTSPETEKLKNNSDLPATEKGKNGGARPGAGRPKGSENEETKQRRAAMQVFKDRVSKAVDRLFNAQLDAALGEKFLYVTREVGTGAKKHRETTMVTDPEIIKNYLDGEYEGQDDDYYFISTKAANNMAIDSLLNRAFGTPQKNVDLTTKGQSILGATDDAELARIAAATSEALADDTDSE